MGSTRPGSLVWPGMILAGLALGAAVWAAWPEPTTRIARLPYGEAQPKAPPAERPRAQQVARVPLVVAQRPRTRVAVAKPQPVEEEPIRVLAAVEEPDVTEELDAADGPAPVPSTVELEGEYVPESPEELGATPLPGTDATPAPPVAG